MSSFSLTISSFSSSRRCRSCLREACLSCSSSILAITAPRVSRLSLLALLSSASEDLLLIALPALLRFSLRIVMSVLESSSCCLASVWYWLNVDFEDIYISTLNYLALSRECSSSSWAVCRVPFCSAPWPRWWRSLARLWTAAAWPRPRPARCFSKHLTLNRDVHYFTEC